MAIQQASKIKNPDVMEQVMKLLSELKNVDNNQHAVIRRLLEEVFLEFNSGKNRNVEKKLYDLIDAEITLILRDREKTNAN